MRCSFNGGDKQRREGERCHAYLLEEGCCPLLAGGGPGKTRSVGSSAIAFTVALRVNYLILFSTLKHTHLSWSLQQLVDNSSVMEKSRFLNLLSKTYWSYRCQFRKFPLFVSSPPKRFFQSCLLEDVAEKFSSSNKTWALADSADGERRAGSRDSRRGTLSFTQLHGPPLSTFVRNKASSLAQLRTISIQVNK